MMSKTTRQNLATKKPTLEMCLDLASFIAGVLARLSFEQVQSLLKNKNTILRKKLEEVFEVPAKSYGAYMEWEPFYLRHFGVTVDLSGVKIPEAPTEGLWHLIFIPQGLTLNAAIVAMRKKFKVWVYNEDLDGNIPTNTRTSATAYAVWVRVGDEPDAEFLGKSTRDADIQGKIGITLLERLLLGLKHFTETGGGHLDIKGVTFCSGSRDAGGRVPGVFWLAGNGGVCVCFYGAGCAVGQYGLRQAVS